MTSALRHRLETPRLSLRPAEPGDADYFFATWNDPLFRRFLWDDQAVPRSVVEEVLAASAASFVERGFGVWAILASEGGALVGFAALRDSPETPGEIELLYGVETPSWGRGYATEAAEAVLRYGLETVGLPRVVCRANPANPASLRVAEKLGMKRAADFHSGREPLASFVAMRESLLAPS